MPRSCPGILESRSDIPNLWFESERAPVGHWSPELSKIPNKICQSETFPNPTKKNNFTSIPNRNLKIPIGYPEVRILVGTGSVGLESSETSEITLDKKNEIVLYFFCKKKPSNSIYMVILYEDKTRTHKWMDGQTYRQRLLLC